RPGQARRSFAVRRRPRGHGPRAPAVAIPGRIASQVAQAQATSGEGSTRLTGTIYNRMVVSMQTTVADFDRTFGALADATRRDIVRRAIGGHEGLCEMGGHYPMSFAAVQKHVAILERAGLVSKERVGRRKVVRTNVEG